MILNKACNWLLSVGLLLSLTCCSREAKNISAQEELTQYVDPFIGTADHGHVFLGANTPYGMVQLGPTQYSQGWDWCSGYHYSDSTIIGFSHMHLSGTGIGDLGDILLMPVIGNVKTCRGELPDQESGIYSYFSHQSETARPGYYAVALGRFGIDVELTTTNRVGFHKYTFPQSDDARVVFNLEHGIGWDAPTLGYLVQENDTVVSGYRKSSGWAKEQEIYFTAVFSKPMKEFIVHDGLNRVDGNSIYTQTAYGQAIFETTDAEEVYVKVALSPVSIDNAKLNLRTELPHWEFNRTVADAEQSWNDELNRIQIHTASDYDKRVFYTALYHTMFFPCTFSDVNGDYRGADRQIHQHNERNNLTVFSLWDTYRAAFPLVSLINPELSKDIASTMMAIYEQQGKLPVWHLVGNETDCMVGNPGICVLADFVQKGYFDDKKAAYEAMKASAMKDDRGMNWLKQYGYIPFDKEVTYETVAKGLEFAIADACVAQLARQLGLHDDYDYFLERSRAYRHYFDTDTKFMRGKSADGKFREPFDPIRSVHMKDDYTEGNAWQYTWLVPHDVNGLVELFGSEEIFISKLDSLFVIEGDIGDEASDITGLIGQYAHGNEPSHHIAYLYTYLGQPWKTADKVRQILSTFYTDQPTGICGNEDVGQMSAWYILSSLGFYQVEPSGGKFVFGSPIFDKAEIKVDGDKVFTIIATQNSNQNRYIQHVMLNGEAYPYSYISFDEIKKGGVLEFIMGDTPSDFAMALEERP